MPTKSLGTLILFVSKVKRRLLMMALRPLFKSAGNGVVFDPYAHLTYSNITLGNHVYIGPGAHFSATVASITIGNKVLFGPNVTIITGDHRMDQIGKAIYDQHEKLPENDIPVVIEDDVWVGTGAIILKGVTIGTGSVVAAGAVVAKSVPPYTIVGGVPAKPIKSRFSETDLQQHLKLVNHGK
jgi:acetyltransferase-like isoleucine patch superfamily enzyme